MGGQKSGEGGQKTVAEKEKKYHISFCALLSGAWIVNEPKVGNASY